MWTMRCCRSAFPLIPHRFAVAPRGNPPSGMPAFGGEVDYEELEKYNAKQDKKLRKIIGDENFEKWRATHPQELPKMPELKLE